MKLVSFRVQNFRNILDSLEIEVQPDVTCLVGKNEAGKTALLEALWRLKPDRPVTFNLDDDYPRWLLIRDRKTGDAQKSAPLTATFLIEDDDRAEIESVFGPDVLTGDEFTIELHYEGPVFLSSSVDEPRAVANFLEDQGLTTINASSFKQLREVLQAQRAAAAGESLGPAVADEATFSTALEDLDRLIEAETSLSLAVSRILRPRLPTFYYFSSYEMLKGTVPLDELANVRDDSEGWLRTAAALLEYADTTVEDLRGDDYEERKAQLEAASNELTSQVFEYWSQNEQLRMEIDVAHQTVNVPQGRMAVAQSLKIRVNDDRHRYTNPFDQRSYGFRWFFSFLAGFSPFETSREPVVILLDEPGLSLHGRAQADFLRFINERLAPRAQVIYTTHSPFMIEPGRLERVRIVEDKGPLKGAEVGSDVLTVDRDTLFPLQAALGYDVAQTLFIGPDNLIVEGTSDYTYLRVVSDYLAEQDRVGLDDRWRILPAGSSANIPTFVALMGPSLDVTVLADAGTEGMQRLHNMSAQGLLPKNRLILVSQVTQSTTADIEDLFTVDDYVSLYNRTFGTSLKVRDLPKGDRVLDRITRKEAKFNHGKPADYFLRRRDEILPKLSAQTLDNFEALFRLVNATLSP